MTQQDRNNLFDFALNMDEFTRTNDIVLLESDLNRFKAYIDKPYYNRAKASLEALLGAMPTLSVNQITNQLEEVIWQIYTAPSHRASLDRLPRAGWLAIQKRLFPESKYTVKKGQIDVKRRELVN